MSQVTVQSVFGTDYDPTPVVHDVTAPNDSVWKRARWEEMDLEVLPSGNVHVTNNSHENGSEHTYHVICDADGKPQWCVRYAGQADDGSVEWEDCPARKYHCEADTSERCKHCLAVAMNLAIVSAVRAVKAGDN